MDTIGARFWFFTIAGYILIVGLGDPASHISNLASFAASAFLMLFGVVSFISFIGSRRKSAIFISTLCIALAFLGAGVVQFKMHLLHQHGGPVLPAKDHYE